ncbi:FAD-dependent oxidoreductase [Archangium violaceum]|uniref:FAD-dependent oxidoreductase n=1 Tax=Archangium violaceum TaxID=83451 RepID=UPI00069692C4|nr:FAD-dependent oxidoreductase [Archangium violaceum]
MSSSENYDVIVVGGGAVGLAAAYHACKDNARVLVLEQYEFINQLSSSNGATRQFRLQYAEAYMAVMVQQAIPFWDELQTHTQETLRTRAGSVWFGDPDVESSEGQIQGAMEVMKLLRIPFEPLTAQQIDERYDFKNLPGNYTGFLQPDGGTLNVPGTLRVMLEQLEASGRATLLPRQKVTQVRSSSEGVSVTTASGTYHAGKLVVTAGPYTNQVLAHLGTRLDLIIWQMVSCYFQKRAPSVDFPSWYVFEAERPEDPGVYYGFEEVSWSHPGYIRVAPAFANHVIEDPSEHTPLPDARDIALTSQWVTNHMPGLEPQACFTSWCMAALPGDDEKKMFLDFAPASVANNDNIVVFAGGWAFKFVPLLGRICADLALKGSTRFDISHFKIPAVPGPRVSLAARRGRRLPF